MASTKAKLVGAVASSQNPAVKGKTGKFFTTGQTDNANLTVANTANNTSSGGSSTAATTPTNTAAAAAANTAAQTGSGTSSLDEAKQRLLDSLDYTYGRKQELSNQSYDRNISQADNAMLSRGMQRSSYSQQVLANMMKQKTEAAGDIESEKIAAYNTGVNQLEQQEREQQNWEKNYALQQESFQFQKDEAARNQRNTDQSIAYSALQSAAAAGNKNVSDELLKRAGLSRQDYNQWLKNTGKKSSGGGGRGGSNPGTQQPGTQQPGDNNNWWDLANANYGNAAGNAALQAIGNQVKKAVNNVNNAYQTKRNPGGGGKRVAMTK